MIGPLWFGAPQLLAALALLPLVAAALRRGERRRAQADRAVGGAAALRRGRSPARRRLRAALLLAAIASAVLAAARPQWGEEQRAVEQRGIDVAIVLDVSRSMTAGDVAPSRAGAAAEALGGLLGGLVGDRAALVTFAGSALVRSPLTRDLEVLAQLVERAQSEAALLRPGSNVGVALQRALDALNVEDAAATQVVVLVSDGEDPAGDRFVDFARDTAVARGVRVYAAVAGAPGGGTLPGAERPGDGPELSVPDAALLAAAARGTGGELRPLASIPGLAVTFRRLAQTRFAEDAERAPAERFQWAAALALGLLGARELAAEGGRRRAGRRRRRLPAPAATALLGLGAALLASCGGSEAYREARAGHQAYGEGRYEESLDRYEAASEAAGSAEDRAILAYNRGNALGRLERYGEAMEEAARAAAETGDPELAAVASYARGVHAARALRLEAARESFVTALLRDPADDDARANLEIVLRALAEAAAEGDPEAGGGGGGEPPSPAAGAAPGAGAAPPAGAPGGAGEPSGPAGGAGGQPGSLPPPGAGASPDGAAGQQPGPGTPAPSAEEARAALAEALAALGSGEMALEEALRLLELIHQLNAVVDLGAPARPGEPLPPR